MMPMRRLMGSMDPIEIAALKGQGLLEEKLSLTMDDFQAAISNTASSVDQEALGRYEEWTAEFASK